jgi:hypothetical protein
MHFQAKNTLKNNIYHTLKYLLSNWVFFSHLGPKFKTNLINLNSGLNLANLQNLNSSITTFIKHILSIIQTTQVQAMFELNFRDGFVKIYEMFLVVAILFTYTTTCNMIYKIKWYLTSIYFILLWYI